MQSSKIDCIHCPQYRTCPQQTRMYVNYCGRADGVVKPKVVSAVADCRARQGRLFKHEVFLPFSKPLLAPAVAA